MLESVTIKEILLLCFAIDLTQSKVMLVHSIFRHGERTTDTKFMYPNDPYRNKTFYPYGNGQLTNEGKLTMYSLGKQLGHRYSDLLGDTYFPEIVDAWASSLPRTQVALQLVLAGLFPPNHSLVWNKDLLWQPIAYNTLPKELDTLLLGILTNGFIEEYNKQCKTKAAKRFMEEAEPALAYIRKHSGLQAYTPREFFFFYITLNTEDHLGLTLPAWTKKIYPQPLSSLIHLNFELEMSTKKLRRLLIGDLMKKILTDTEDTIFGKKNRRINLYSAHDVNIAYILIFFDQMYKHAPGYSATLVIEVHEENSDYFIEVHYRENKHSDFKLLPFPNHETRMPLAVFRDLVNNLLEIEENPGQNGERLLNNSSNNFEEWMSYYQSVFMLLCYRYLVQ
ncbi:hypothetical protein Trydic_g1574 [Trypoxylus dichotomus]